MDCREAILSNDYADFIYGYDASLFGESYLPEEYCSQRAAVGLGVYYARRSDIPPLNIQFYNYSSFPKLFTTVDTGSMEASGVLQLQNQPFLNLRGQGVLIGFVDTGIDYTNPVFQDDFGNTRIAGIWDQTNQEGTPPAGLLYGSEYTGEMIQEALRSLNPLEIVPETDDDGHGTFMSGIAAGRFDVQNNFTGAAPEASIAMVKLKPAKQYLKDFYQVSGDGVVYQETDIMLGLRYLMDLQRRLRMPMVVCIGLGTNSGGHTSATPLGYILNYMSTNIGTAVVAAGGNEANKAHHYLGTIDSEGGYEDVEIRVPDNAGGFSVELWANAPEQYSVELISPSGESTRRIPVRIGGGGVYRFILDQSTAYVDYQSIELFLSQLALVRLQTPSPGIWTLRVYNDYFINGRFNVWLPITGLVNDDIVFLRPNPDITITVPSTTNSVISVGAYNHVNGSIYINSGRGYSRNDTIKPDITAPGVNVYGALPGNRFSRRSGTSVAAAHTAGAAALLLQWGIIAGNFALMSGNDVKTILIRGAKRSPDISYPSRVWGYGTLDVYASIERTNR